MDVPGLPALPWDYPLGGVSVRAVRFLCKRGVSGQSRESPGASSSRTLGQTPRFPTPCGSKR